MNLIDYTAFESGIVAIPVHDETSDVGIAIIASIDDFIERVQPEVLIDVMGEDFYDLFIAGLGETTPETRWTALEAVCVLALPYFVYYEYDIDRQTISTEAGEINVQAANIQRVSALRKWRKVYNYGVDQLEKVYEFLQDNATDYPEWTDIGFDFEHINAFNI